MLHVPHRRVRSDRRDHERQPGTIHKSLVRSELHKQSNDHTGPKAHSHICTTAHKSRRRAHV